MMRGQVCNFQLLLGIASAVFLMGIKVKVKVTLRLTVSQSVCLGVEPNYLLDFYIYIYIYIDRERERERERERRESWGRGSERHYIGGGLEKTISSV
jgi:hypothetical protein